MNFDQIHWDTPHHAPLSDFQRPLYLGQIRVYVPFPEFEAALKKRHSWTQFFIPIIFFASLLLYPA